MRRGRQVTDGASERLIPTPLGEQSTGLWRRTQGSAPHGLGAAENRGAHDPRCGLK